MRQVPLLRTCLGAFLMGGMLLSPSALAEDLDSLEDGTCHVSGRLTGQLNSDGSIDAGVVTVAENCSVSITTKRISPQQSAAPTAPLRGPSIQHRVKGTMRAEHVQLLMAQIDSFLTWGSNGLSVTAYQDGSASTSTGGCGWHVTDGPYSWYDAGEMPYTIYNYGWAYFESCSPTVNGWLEAGVWGDYDQGYNATCDYDIQVPYGSSLQCYPTLLY